MSYFQKGLNKEPAMVISAILGIGSLLLPVIIPTYRELNDKPTFQWEGDNSHPVGGGVLWCCPQLDSSVAQSPLS